MKTNEQILLEALEIFLKYKGFPTDAETLTYHIHPEDILAIRNAYDAVKKGQ